MLRLFNMIPVRGQVHINFNCSTQVHSMIKVIKQITYSWEAQAIQLRWPGGCGAKYDKDLCRLPCGEKLLIDAVQKGLCRLHKLQPTQLKYQSARDDLFQVVL